MARWEYNIRMDLKEIEVGVNNWMGSAQDMLYRRALLMRIEPPDSTNHGENYHTLINHFSHYSYALFNLLVSLASIVSWNLHAKVL
jgi:hypothetical protein